MLNLSPHSHLSRARALACAAAACGAFATCGAIENADASFTTNVGNNKLIYTGDASDDGLTLRLNAADHNKIDVDFGNDGTIDQQQTRSNFTNIDILGGIGKDVLIIDDSNGVFADTETLFVDGGNDEDTILAGGGPSVVHGGRAHDFLFGGGGADTFTWDPGDNSDTLEGQAGTDTLDFNGANISETMKIEPFGSRVLVTRDVGAVTQDLHDVENLDLDAIGGADTITAGNLAGAIKLDIDGGSGGDTITGSDGADKITGGFEDDTIHGRGGADAIAGNEGIDSLFGDAGTDKLDGGPAADKIACGGFGDAIVADPLDTIAADCKAPPPPPPPPPADPTPPADPAPAPAPEQPAPAPAPGEPTPAPAPAPAPVPPTTSTLPAGFRGFAKPVVRPTRTGLKVTLRSTHSAPIDVRIRATESKRRYKTITRTIAAGGKVTIKLKAPRAVRTRVARTLAKRGRIVRRPRVVVTNVATGGKTAIARKLTLKR